MTKKCCGLDPDTRALSFLILIPNACTEPTAKRTWDLHKDPGLKPSPPRAELCADGQVTDPAVPGGPFGKRDEDTSFVQ